MPPYNKETPCVKCGETGAASEWRDAVKGYSTNVPERILRTCTNCDYTWTEAPLDADNETA